MSIEKKPFKRYDLDSTDSRMSLKLNPKNEEMIAIGKYAFNEEKSGTVLKILAEMGLKVILDQIGVETMHKLSRGDRKRFIQEKPKLEHYSGKVPPF